MLGHDTHIHVDASCSITSCRNLCNAIAPQFYTLRDNLQEYSSRLSRP